MALVDVHLSSSGTHAILTVVGELDIDGHEAFTEVASRAVEDSEQLVLDLSGVGFIDSTGIGALARVRKDLSDRDRPAHVVPSPRVRAALRLTALTEVFVVHDTLQDAVLATESDPGG